ncbi:dual specificity protein phosphatase family protein [Thermogemmatispora sp.]|jgi:protein-tyrosine phosphatase|uniref:protein-tyrosine phosphatase family protein n=1 Tax=Thermogemmatispora sp. TaxID=1968838 RepID=UPI0035E439C0
MEHKKHPNEELNKGHTSQQAPVAGYSAWADPPLTTAGTAPVSGEAPHLKFSRWRWALTGVVRVLYRRWTRIAAHLFPENSPTERLARALHIPLPDQLNLSWITDQLAVGGRIHPQDIKALARLGVTHVVDTRAEYVDDRQALAKAGIELLHLPTPDTQPLSLEQLLEGARWVNERIQHGGRVLVHCEHGVGRSALLACAVLVYGGMHARDALALVQQRRWQAAPNHKQVERLREFESAVRAGRSR